MVDRSAELLTGLSRAGGLLLAARTVASASAVAVEELQRLFGADHVALHLLSGRTLSLETYVPAEDFPLMLDSGHGLLPAAMEQASPAAIGDLASSRWAEQERGLVEAGVRSVLVVPVRGQNGLAGCATLLYREPRAFHLWETGAAEALLLQAAAVIERCRAVDGAGDYHDLLDRLHTAYEQTLLVLADALQARDRYMAGHARRSMELAAETAEAAQFSPDVIRRIRYAALLRDIGYLAIPDAVLLKAGELTAEEWEMIRAHPVISGRLIESVDWLRDAVPVVVAHHERVDGDGYPAGLAGEEIPIGARVIAVADAYQAMISPRAYRGAMEPRSALFEIRRASGRQFDPAILDVFLPLMERRLKG